MVEVLRDQEALLLFVVLVVDVMRVQVGMVNQDFKTLVVALVVDFTLLHHQHDQTHLHQLQVDLVLLLFDM